MQKDTSQLVEFPRFEEETTQSGVSNFLNKLWKFPLFSPSETNENLQNKALTDGKQSTSQADVPRQEYEDTKPEIGGEPVEFEGRSLQNVLRRISSLVALGSGGGTRYADTELARYWMPDDISKECYECATRFSALRRRHHCRVCGQIFCSRCCSQRVPGHIFGCNGGLRVCNYCCNIVLRYLKENDASGDMSTDLKTLQENLQAKFPDNKCQQSNSRDNFVFAREQEDRCERPASKEALQDVFKQLSFALPTQQHRYRLVRYNGVWRGCDILQWIMDNTHNKTRAQATQVCQRLLNSGYMECSTELHKFADYALYRPLLQTTPNEDESPEEETRIAERSVSSYCLDLNLGESSARLIKAPKAESKSTTSCEDDHPNLEQSEEYTESNNICKAIVESGEDHLKLLMRQCLARQSLSAAWLALYPLCQQAAEIVMPDLYSNDIDVRNYVQVKKIPGDTIRDSCVIQGVVMTKNVAHRGMPQQISNPTILLLDCSIAYQRVEGKLTSLEPLLMQEQEYLVRCAARILALRPRLVMVGGACARTVQDQLRASDLALAARVRAPALARVARTTKAEIVTSIDARIGMPKLGTCRNFYVKNYPTKTLMVLEGCAEPQLGCCILLRGASIQELIRVKKVVKFMLLACYNWKLEKAFLGDIQAVLPEPGTTFDDDNDVFNDKSNESLKSNDKDNDIADENEKGNDADSNDTLKLDTSILKCSDDEKNNDSKSTDTKINDNEAIEESNDKTQEKRDVDDPLQKSKAFVRKTDSDKNPSCGVPIRDFSDPLRALGDDEVFLPKADEKFEADDDLEDRWSREDTVLSMSPNSVIPPPYLESRPGRRCGWRALFPRLRPRPAPAPAAPVVNRREDTNVTLKPVHPFISTPITTVDDPALRASLASFRATGCQLVNNHHIPGCPLYKPTVIKTTPPIVESTEKIESNEPLDPLAPENHQRLSMLLYSYSSKSANVPDFCVNPWIATMEMYGKHDISLGAFLQKYCFRDLKCTSNNCQVPMNQHVRKFVHGDVCITITCNTVGHSNMDKIKEEQSKQVLFWSRCGTCGAGGVASRLSPRALSLSLSAYVRARAAAARYCGACAHPLHAHKHAFVRGATTACFKYSKISTFDIKLPTEVIFTKYDTKQMRDALLSQLNELVPKGHETFAGISDSEAEREHQGFKQHVDQIHLALTTAKMQEQNSLAAVVRSLWGVADRIIAGEKMLRDAQDKWSSPVKPVRAPQESVEEKSDLEDSTGEPGDSSGTEEDEEKGDKKTVRQILTQLLSNNQPSNQHGMIISSGLVPVVVQAGEVGSVIAATLASLTYQKTLRTQLHSIQTEQEESESTGSGREKSEGDKPKVSKSNDHIEVLLKDGLVCRVYFAAQFHKLRRAVLAPLSAPHGAGGGADPHGAGAGSCCDDSDKESKSLCDIEEGFIRSLAYCVPWAARGGKSGSTFCKTKDDRYVLKEMTKPEWQQFLEFAPHYFNYVTTCHQSKIPSLLARIVGMFGVGGSGACVLVLEHVWYGCARAAPRYDLKGSERPRRYRDTGDAVLLDENLLHMRWETPLYIQSHVGSVLWSCIERDTDFLAANSVMDYSLLLAIDNNTLVLGIIDYIRTFTWDKKLEHLVKKNLGSGQPTVVSPEEYKRRFCNACRKYFLQCPAHWDHLYNTVHA